MSEDFPALGGFRPGSLVAGYRLEAQVGAGGMAVVFRARDERLGRLVALKILAPALAADAGFRRRFIAESRAAAAVDDPHIVPVFEAGEVGGVLFIAMRFVAGGDLRGVLDREGPLGPGRAAGFLSPVASALDAAHRAGLVHRDVKPANILVDAHQDRPDHVYLSDFGVSKGAGVSVSMTGTGQFLGTPDYSAPEQVQGGAVDGRTDQYALACVAFQLLTGSAPFERDQGMAVLLAHLSEPPPSLSSRRPGLPAAADQVLARALAKAPQERYGSCREFADALRDALGQSPYISQGLAPPAGHPPTEIGAPGAGLTTPNPAGAAPNPDRTTGSGVLPDPAAALTLDAVPRRSQASTPQHDPAPSRPAGITGRSRSFRLRAAAALAAIVAIAAGVSAFALSGGGTGSNSGRTSAATNVPSRITLTDPGTFGAESVAFSPNGKILAVGDWNSETYVWSLATRTVTATLTGPKNTIAVQSVAFSPDGNTLAVGDGDGSTYLWNLATRTLTATLTTPKSSVQSVAFSPDGNTLAVGDSDGSTYLWNVATHTITATLTIPDAISSRTPVNSVAFSPDGTVLAAGENNGSTYLWNLATATITATLADPSSPGLQSVAFSPDGKTLATGDENGSTYVWSLATRTITATFTERGDGSVRSVAFSPHGTTLAAAENNGNAYVWSLATRRLTAALTDPGSDNEATSVAFSPDGSTLAVGEWPNGTVPAPGSIDGSTYLWNVLHPASSS